MSIINEFVEKLIGRLEEKQDEYFHGTSDYEEGKYNAYDEVAQIVNQLAEEYKDVPDTNVGKWILCSDRLPDEESEVIVSTKTERVKVGIYTKKYGFGMRGGFICDDGFMYINTANAWQPLPEPYKGE